MPNFNSDTASSIEQQTRYTVDVTKKRSRIESDGVIDHQIGGLVFWAAGGVGRYTIYVSTATAVEKAIRELREGSKIYLDDNTYRSLAKRSG